MSKAVRVLLPAAVALLLAAALVQALLVRPYRQAETAISADTEMVIRQQEDGDLLLSWTPTPEVDAYLVEVRVLSGPHASEKPVFSRECAETECLLPASLPGDVPLELRLSPQKRYEVLGRERMRTGETPFRVQCYLNRPEITQLRWQADPETASVELRWNGWQGDDYRLYVLGPDGAAQLLREPERVSARVTFGETGDLPMPERDESYRFRLDAVRELPGLTYYGRASDTVTVTRQDLLGTTLTVDCAELGENVYTLTWNETKGERYQVQMFDAAAGGWVTLAEIPAADERSYRTDHLRPYTDCRLRVTAVGGQTLPGSDYAAESEAVTVTTDKALLYATVWPTKALTLYADTDRRESVGTTETGKALCVLEEKDGMFRVRTGAGEGYIDSNYCMINLPDYIGDLCSYDITNAYSSLYLIHNHAIALVSGTVIEGYEHVLLGDGTFLVPLLYPTAQKLIDAALALREDGYRIKIYDSFRPNVATRSIYELTGRILDDPVPEGEVYVRRTLEEYFRSGAAIVPREPERPSEEETGEPEENVLTYRTLMTNGVYNLGSFLASYGSMHNLGIAMDLTLERIDDGQELEMQTWIHDLSWYSAMPRNNANAKMLDGYMKAAGFGTIGSEWWHFQDNEIRAAISPPNVRQGVSVEGWKYDGVGWRYRNADGSWIVGTTAGIGGVDYVFDAAGYVTA